MTSPTLLPDGTGLRCMSHFPQTDGLAVDFAERNNAVLGVVYRTAQRALEAQLAGDIEGAKELMSMAQELNLTLPVNWQVDLSKISESGNA
jgi:hypothetical protein